LERWRPTGQERTWYPTGADERARLLWHHFRTSQDQSIALRYARGLAHVLDNIAIDIEDDELIVGQVGLEDIAETHPDELAQAKAFWQARQERFHRSLPSYDTAQKASDHALSWKWHNRDGHAIPAFDLILTAGLAGLRAQAAQAAARYELGAPDYDERQVFWKAMDVALFALSSYIRRHAALARDLAASANPQRADELRQIRTVCGWIADRAPRTLWEALQLVWFVHLGIKMDDGGIGHSFGRFDQYLYPYYSADIRSGRLTTDGARDLLALFWIKLNREGDGIAHLSLGGQTPTGEDATNELSHLCLQVDRWVSRKQPNLSTRVHAGTPDDYWREIAHTMRRGAGHPAIFSDEVIVPGMIDYGLSPELARDYAQVGCVETFLPGLGAPWTDCYLNLAKCLELALSDGRDALTDVQLGPSTGDARHFQTFDDLMSAYERQVQCALHDMLAAKDDYDAVVSQHVPEPLNSAFIRDCLQQGLDATGGGARYLLTGAYGVGLGTTVDSLAALKALVYEDSLLTMEEMLAALEVNFDGYEEVLSLCRNRAPKYGNDDPRADEVAVRVIESFGRQAQEYPSRAPNALHYAMLGSVLGHTTMGALTGASANGRRATETLSDGGSPSQGCNHSGATATLRSLTKADYRLAPGGAAINLRLSPSHLAGQAGIDRLVGLLKGYVAMGGEQLQVTVVDTETLRRALEQPDEYRDLVVRVAGFTAYFVTLTPELQHEIIARSETAL
jgi:formate C-acetyltransferase